MAAVERQLSEFGAPPSAPIEYPQPVDWSLLIAICGGAYCFVMVAVVISVCYCKKSRSDSSNQFSNFDQESGSQPAFRAVQRDRSWKHRARTSPGTDLSTIPAYIKMGFIRKVYSILATQLMVTVAIVVGMIYGSFRITATGPTSEPPYTEFGNTVLSSAWIIYLLIIPVIAVICALVSMKNKYPHNYILLSVFTVLESITVGFICVLYFAAGFGEQILLSFAITLMIFLVLTAFTMQSKIDWSFLAPFLFTSLFLLCFWSFFTFWLVPYSFGWRKFISLAGAIVFCFFIIYDTNNIMKHMGVDDYIIAAIELYLDIINLFQYLLMLLSSTSR